jgi:hypothetical protein
VHVKRLLMIFTIVTPIAILMWLGPASAFQSNVGNAPGTIMKKGIALDVRAIGRQIADEVAHGNLPEPDEIGPLPDLNVVQQIPAQGNNVQVNDPGLDNIQIFPHFRPFVEFTQSETSVAASGGNIVTAYNTSANQPLVEVSPGVLAFTRRFLSGFSVSDDGGQTWSSGFLPPLDGSIFTFGDPSLDVDRFGNFYFAGLGADALGRSTIQFNKSADAGHTWSKAVLIQQDDGGDKPWLAVGPDPLAPNHDNVYVVWASFQSTGSIEMRFGRSTDGGATWATKTIFAPPPNPDPTLPQNALQFVNPYVDPITGTLYIPFLHFSNADQDFIQILASDDAGATFRFLTFNVAGAPDPTLLPVTQPGELTDCRSGGVRLTIQDPSSIQPGRLGLRSFMNATRLTLQPAFAAFNGTLYLTWSNSTSLIFGAPHANSNILFMRSADGGNTWSVPVQVNPTVSTDTHHVLPALSLDPDGKDVHIAYYTQHSNGTIDVDLANSFDGASFPANRLLRLTGSPMMLPPTNVILTANTSTNYDRTIQPCYALGEYLSIRSANGTVHAAWGDTHNTVTEPVNVLDPLSGQTHPQEDVFYRRVNAQ